MQVKLLCLASTESAEEDRNSAATEDPDQTEKDGGDQTLSAAEQSTFCKVYFFTGTWMHSQINE